MTGPDPPAEKRFRKLYVLWGLALALLICAALFSWKVAVPALRVRAVLREVAGEKLDREAAVERLGGAGAAAPALALYLRLPRRLAPGKEPAVGLLVECGRSGVGPLVRVLHSRDPTLRAEAAWGLLDVQMMFFEGFGGKSAHPEIVAGLARGAVGDIHVGEALEKLLILCSPPDSALPALAGVLGSPGTEPALRCSVAGWFGRKGPRAGKVVPALIAALGDADPDVRGEAAGALGEVGDPRALAPLRAALKDRSWKARCGAAESLGKFGARAAAAAPALAAALADEEELVRRYAARALGEVGAGFPAAASALEAALRDEDKDVREAAAEALKKIREAQGGDEKK